MKVTLVNVLKNKFKVVINQAWAEANMPFRETSKFMKLIVDMLKLWE
jgi:hypothetical protein